MSDSYSHAQDDLLRWNMKRDAAIAAVERELAAKDAEIAELRKRPTLDEVLDALDLREPRNVEASLERQAISYVFARKAKGADKARAEDPK